MSELDLYLPGFLIISFKRGRFKINLGVSHLSLPGFFLPT
jgi:hypothetical protein